MLMACWKGGGGKKDKKSAGGGALKERRNERRTSKNLPENTNKEATYRTAIHIEIVSKILKKRILSEK
jgi:hypothetical protein